MSKKKNVHVTPNKNGDGWSIKSEGASKAYRIVPTKKEAQKIGKNVAKNNEGELIIHNTDGKISDKDSYGNDPNPPKDKVN